MAEARSQPKAKVKTGAQKLSKRWEEELERVRSARDELRVQANLAAKEARDHFKAAEKLWQKLEGKARVLARAGREEAVDVRAAVDSLLGELKEAYAHIRRLL